MNDRYILLTAAKNEEEYIGKALESVARQTVLPLAWIIVDDGSTDRTAEVIRQFIPRCPFIRLESSSLRSARRSFGSKDKAINAAYALAKTLDFDYVGVQDADIAPERNDYYELIISHFRRRQSLGIAGGSIHERTNGIWRARKGNSADSVAGGIQMFRRTCYEQIGGYTPLDYGGEDWLSQLEAKMAGWETLACQDCAIFHYRPTSSAGGKLRGAFRAGLMDASFGSHPLFEIVKCGRRLTASPWLIGSGLRFTGYLWWRLCRRSSLIAPEKTAFLRKEQLAKLRSWARPWSERAEVGTTRSVG